MGQEQIMTVQTVEKVRKDFKRMVDKIHKAQSAGNKSMIDIAHALTVLSEDNFEGILKEHSCNNIADYAELEFGIGKTSTYDSIKVFSAFGDINTGKLLPEFAEYTFSQLKMIAPAVLEDKNGFILLPDCNSAETEAEYVAAIKDKFPAEMKVREIQEAVKELRKIDKQKIDEAQKSEEEYFSDNTESACEETAKEELEYQQKEDNVSDDTGALNFTDTITISDMEFKVFKYNRPNMISITSPHNVTTIDSTVLSTLFYELSKYVDIASFTVTFTQTCE